jgi:hypothetical protein
MFINYYENLLLSASSPGEHHPQRPRPRSIGGGDQIEKHAPPQTPARKKGIQGLHPRRHRRPGSRTLASLDLLDPLPEQTEDIGPGDIHDQFPSLPNAIRRAPGFP